MLFETGSHVPLLENMKRSMRWPVSGVDRCVVHALVILFKYKYIHDSDNNNDVSILNQN